MRNKSLVVDHVRHLEHELAKNKAVLEAFPNARFCTYGYQSEDVNQKYTKFSFEQRWRSVWVAPYFEVSFTFDNKEEKVNVYGSPKASRLVYVHWDYKQPNHHIIKFSRLAFNLKSNNIKDDVLNDCRIEIMKFIKENSKYKIDDKHLEPRLKNLLVFT